MSRLRLLVVFVVPAIAAAGCFWVRPTPRDPGVLAFDGALGNRFVHAAQANEIVARLRLGTRAISHAQRPKINLALVVDTSGSMEGRAIEDARAASLTLIGGLANGDRVAVVAFHSRTEMLVPATELTNSRRAEIRRALGEMRAQGTTDLAGGLRAGLAEVLKNLDPDGINRVVLMSDGVPNDANGIEALAAAAGERGVSITSLGLGVDYDESLMGAIAVRSGGRFHYIANSSEVASVFRDEVLRLRRVVARNAVLVLQSGPGIHIDSVIGQPVSQDAAGARLVLGDVADGDQRDILVRLSGAGRRAGATVEILDATIAFDDGVAGAGRLERRVYLGARSTADAAEFSTGRNEDVERVAARAQAAAGTVEAIRLARGGEYERARAYLDRCLAEARHAAAASGDTALEAQVSSIARVREALPSVGRPAAGEVGTPAQAPSLVYEAHDEAVRTLLGH